MARLSVSYMLWFFGGVFGFHHLYLGRLSHAVFFAITFGFCGIGWVYDFFKMPQYVKQANNDPIYLSLLRKKLKSRPPFSFPRALSLYVACYMMTHVSISLLGVFEPIESRIGTNNISESPIWWTLLTSAVQTIGVLIACLIINSVGGQRTVARHWLYVPIVIGTAADILLAYLSSARILVICRALFPTLFYVRSCEWLPQIGNKLIHDSAYTADRGNVDRLQPQHANITQILPTTSNPSKQPSPTQSAFPSTPFLKHQGTVGTRSHKTYKYTAPARFVIRRSYLRFITFWLKYIGYIGIMLTLMFFTVYHFGDVFVDIDGSVEYSDSNYGINTLSFQQIQFPFTASWGTVNNTTVIQGDSSSKLFDIVVTPSTNTHTYSKLSKSLSWSTPALRLNHTQNEPVHTVLNEEGYQPQYTYNQFASELFQYYTSIEKQRANSGSITYATHLAQLSLPYHYRIKDVLRNMYYSPLFHNFNPQSEGNNFTVYTIPFLSPVLSKMLPPTISYYLELFETVVISRINKALIMAQISYHHIMKNGIVSFVDNVDICGRFWSTYFLSALQQQFIYNKTPITSTPVVTLDSAITTASPPQYSNADIEQIVHTIIMKVLTPVHGDVTKLNPAQQHLLYDTLVAYART